EKNGKIKDLNSTNGTWVNGKRLEAYTLQEIKPEDIISLADTELIFK
ncbi:MAG: FHA domain-containing protein, partial [Parasporobacterium sp.]|nr:FHA domain-containing protein [Parasporobacterium sp.]